MLAFEDDYLFRWTVNCESYIFSYPYPVYSFNLENVNGKVDSLKIPNLHTTTTNQMMWMEIGLQDHGPLNDFNNFTLIISSPAIGPFHVTKIDKDYLMQAKANGTIWYEQVWMHSATEYNISIGWNYENANTIQIRFFSDVLVRNRAPSTSWPAIV